MLESIIKTSQVGSVNAQLKGVNIILNTLNEDIKKIKEKVVGLLDENKIKENKKEKKEEVLNNEDDNDKE